MKPIAAFGITFGSIILAFLAVGACSGADGRTGPAGPAGSPGTNATGIPGASGVSPTLNPNVSAIIPNSASVGRTSELTISGDNTSWSDSTTVSFTDPSLDGGVDPSIAVTAARHSDTSLTATITIPPETTPGLRDVQVSTPGQPTQTYKNFEIRSTLKVTVVGDLKQGSLVKVTAQNLDKTTPFESGTTITAGALDLTNAVVNPTTIQFLALINPYLDLEAGAQQLLINSGGLSYKDSKSLLIEARSPTELVGKPASSNAITLDMQSFLFSETLTANNIGLVELKLTADADASVTPEVSFIPLPQQDTTVLDGIQSTFVAKSTGDRMILGFDGNGAAGYNFIVYNSAALNGSAGFTLEVSATAVPVSPLAKQDGNDTQINAMAIDLASPQQIVGAAFSTSTGEDWYKFVVPPGNDKAILVGTFASSNSELATDTIVDLYFDTASTPMLHREQKSCFNQIRVPSAGSGTYYVRVMSQPPGPADGGVVGGPYSVFFMLN